MLGQSHCAIAASKPAPHRRIASWLHLHLMTVSIAYAIQIAGATAQYPGGEGQQRKQQASTPIEFPNGRSGAAAAAIAVVIVKRITVIGTPIEAVHEVGGRRVDGGVTGLVRKLRQIDSPRAVFQRLQVFLGLGTGRQTTFHRIMSEDTKSIPRVTLQRLSKVLGVDFDADVKSALRESVRDTVERIDTLGV